jgi:hypothetical protein
MAVLAALKFKPNRRIMSEGLHIHSYLYSEPLEKKYLPLWKFSYACF